MNSASIFIPCLVDLFFPEVAEACFFLFRHLGMNPVYHKEQTCCGQPVISSGHRAQAKEAAKHFIKVFGEDNAVICPSGSCVHTVKRRYSELLEDEPDWLRRSEELAPRVHELTRYIVDIAHVEDVGAVFDGKVAYHESCQLARGLGVSEQPKKLLRAVKGTELVPLNRAEVCCGFGGKFSDDYSEISEAMVGEKAANFIASGADVLIAGDPGCVLNIGGYLSRHHPERKVMHIASFLAAGVREGRKK